MLYYVKNKSGNISDVTERIYKRCQKDDEYECWTEDPYKSVPKEVEDNAEPEKEYPVRTGGSWYLLSNGEKVQGKKEAIEAQKALD